MIRAVCAVALIGAVAVIPANAHSGGTDSKGGHWDHSTGEYHYHHGQSAHQHYDMDGDGILDCPYDFEKISYSGGGGSDSGYRDGYDKGYAEGYAAAEADASWELGIAEGKVKAAESAAETAKAAMERVKKESKAAVEQAEKDAYARVAVCAFPVILVAIAFAVLAHDKVISGMTKDLAEERKKVALLQEQLSSSAPEDEEVEEEGNEVESSFIKSISYRDGHLFVEMPNGTYCYYNVPESVYRAFLAAPSKGKFFHEHIRDKHPYY